MLFLHMQIHTETQNTNVPATQGRDMERVISLANLSPLITDTKVIRMFAPRCSRRCFSGDSRGFLGQHPPPACTSRMFEAFRT